MMDLSPVLQLEGAQGLQRPQQNLDRRMETEDGSTTSSKDLNVNTNIGLIFLLNVQNSRQCDYVVFVQSSCDHVFHHVTSWMSSLCSRMDRATAAHSSVDRQMLEG